MRTGLLSITGTAACLALVFIQQTAAAAPPGAKAAKAGEPPKTEAPAAATAPAPTAAQPAPASPAPQTAAPAQPAAPPPDVVLTKDGSMLRGTIIEKKGNEYVSILLINGETRKIAAQEVTYAGPSAQMPTAQPAPAKSAEATPASPQTGAKGTDGHRPLITVHAAESRLKLKANLPNVTFQLRTGGAQSTASSGITAVADAYNTICTAPCEASLPSGTHQLALSIPGLPPAKVETPVPLPAGDHTVEGEYKSRAGVRTAGYIIGAAGGLGGLAIMFAGIAPESYTMIGGGLALMTVSLFGGSYMTGIRDVAEIRIVPTNTGLRRSPARVAEAQPTDLLPNGVALAGTF